MDTNNRLHGLCCMLESSKITERKTGCEQLREFLIAKSTIEFLKSNENNSWWNRILSSIQSCLIREADRTLLHYEKTGKSTGINSVYLFTEFLSIAVKEGANLKVKKIINFIFENFKNVVLKTHYQDILMKTVSHTLFANSTIRSQLQNNDWEELFILLKASSNIKNVPNAEMIECLALVVKWGPLYTLPVNLLRQQFTFISGLCHSISSTSPINLQVATLKLIQEFSKHVAKDNRIACCKLGEEVITTVLDWYEGDAYGQSIKSTIIDFCLLQMSIHHPVGVKLDHPTAYAFNRTNWNNCVRRIYYILSNDIEFNLRSSVTNLLFYVSRNGIRLILDSFVLLFVSVCRQIFESSNVDVSMGLIETDDEQPSKRQKLTIGVSILIDKIQTTKSWAWMALTSALIQEYPDMITSKHYLELLQILSSLKNECKDATFRHHYYNTLAILSNVEQQIHTTEYNAEIETYWKLITDMTFRLDMNDELIQKFLQSFIQKQNLLKPEYLLKNYRVSTKILSVNEHTLNTLFVIFRRFPNLQSDTKIKEAAIEWVFSVLPHQNYSLWEKIAQFLFYVLLKQWPITQDQEENNTKLKPFQEIEDIYLGINFEQTLLTTTITKKSEIMKIVEASCVDWPLLNFLTNSLIEFVNHTNDNNTPVIDLDMTVLLHNILSYLMKNDLIQPDSELLTIFRKIAKRAFFKLKINVENLAITNSHVDVLNALFSANISVHISKILRELVPEALIKSLFVGLQVELKAQATPLECFKRNAVETLTNFSCLPDINHPLQMQQRALDVLLMSEYNFQCDFEFELVIVLIKTLKPCCTDALSEDTLVNVYNLFQKMYSVRGRCVISAANILNLYSDILPIVFNSSFDIYKKQFTELLFLFYEKYLDYGPEISVTLLNCISLLYDLDMDCQFSRWSNEEIILKIPEFLINNYQEVRFTAIKSIARFFQKSSNTHLLKHYHLQEIMFSKINNLSANIFEVEGDFDNECILDETVTRLASVLHTYSSIMIASNLWTTEALCAMLRIIKDKAIDLDQVNKVIEVVSKSFGFENSLVLLEKYLLNIFENWNISHINKFPFYIFKSETKIQFYATYWNTICYIILKNDSTALAQVASFMDKEIPEIIQECTPKLLSCCIAEEIKNLNGINQNTIYQCLLQHLGVKELRQTFENGIDEVLLNLVLFINDEADFLKEYKQNIIFPKINNIVMNVEQFQDSIQFIENSICDSTPIIEYILQKQPQKIHFVLLNLQLQISNAQWVQDKLRFFYIYSITIHMSIDAVLEETHFQLYLFRDTFHTLLQFIENYKQQPELSDVCSTLLSSIIQKIVTTSSAIASFKIFFVMLVSRLKKLVLDQSPLTTFSVNLLRLLIIENSETFLDEIQKIDSIPNIASFENIFQIYNKIKLANPVTLKNEVELFLNFIESVDDLDECEDGLKQIGLSLSAKKDELKQLYQDLRSTRGFSEDAINSHLHRLICAFVKLACSHSRKVSTEAVRCLGELGPANLATLVLEAESAIVDSKWSPMELLNGYAIVLLSKYLVDGDVKAKNIASPALVSVLETKEGRKVIESGTEFGLSPYHKGYLSPFLLHTITKSKFNITINGDLFRTLVDNDNLWKPQDQVCHKTWITTLVCTLFTTFTPSNLISNLIALCNRKAEFCEQMLPLVLLVLLSTNLSIVAKIISERIANFLDEHWEIIVLQKDTERKTITTNKVSLQCILNVVNFIRLQKNHTKQIMKVLTFDYLKVAQAAQFCTAHFTALLYAELWCQQQLLLTEDDYDEFTSGLTKLDFIYEQLESVTREALQSILRQAYKAVGETDALLGCGTSYLLNPQNRVEHYKELGIWDQVTHRYAMDVSNGQNQSLIPLMDSLKHFNLHEIALFYSFSVEEPDWESLWRLGQWDYQQKSTVQVSELSETIYDKAHFYSLKAYHENDQFTFEKSFEDMKSCFVDKLKTVNLESCKIFYTILSEVQVLKELEDFWKACKNNTVLEILHKWNYQDEINENDFQYSEPIKAQRVVLLTNYLQKQHTKDTKQTVIDMLLNFAEYSRVEGRYNITRRTLETLCHVPGLSDDVKAKIQLEEAQISWSLQDVATARCILRQLCTDENVHPRLHAMALKMTGKWLVESSSENRQTVIDNYFLKSLDLLKNISDRTSKDEQLIVDTFDQLAKFTDKAYQQAMIHIKSDVFQKKIRHIKQIKETIKDINLKKATKDLKKAVSIKEKQRAIDEMETRSFENEKDSLLKFALKYYLQSLIRSDKHNISIFRLISLLLENRSTNTVVSIIEKNLNKIPSYKFIDILPQIIPHISSATNDTFSETIIKVVEKCAKEHPYHTLPLILSLAFSNKDREYCEESKYVINDVRTQCAKNILKSLSKDKSLASLIVKMEAVSDAMIQMAYYTGGSDAENRDIMVPKNFKLRKMQDLDDVLLPTYHLPVEKNCSYTKIVGIQSFFQTYQALGGINCPKQIKCRGTDGLVRTQLVKGQDDLRQDAVMQQVFTMMNSLLSINKQTKNLFIRTYKIVPLSMRSGVLEWVENSMRLGDYLSSAHVKYRPSDKAPSRCREDLRANANRPPEARLRIFKQICKSIKPIFHKFFETTFPQATVWYERRRAYMHSVATSSMCGYMLGIGDRHVSNILIDKSTAEVIHIDFGIAFEQGKVLPTPETVPFRLTRDIVDGMGVSGVEGVFRRSCEKTVEVLRLHYQTIMAILEVLLYDPLYDWTVSTAEANKRQLDEHDSQPQITQSSEEDSTDINVTAERALLRLGAKLLGTENGQSMSVEHQVSTLIQQSMDPANLCRLFHGWQSYF